MRGFHELVIRPPDDPGGFERLQAELRAHRARLRGDVGPLLQMEEVFTVDILERFLASGFDSFFWRAAAFVSRFWRPGFLDRTLERRKIETYFLQREMVLRYGEDFDPNAFWSAWDVVDGICRNGHGGH